MLEALPMRYSRRTGADTFTMNAAINYYLRLIRTSE
jgi:hypothetical protein